MKVIEFLKYIQLKVTNSPSTGVIGISNAPFLESVITLDQIEEWAAEYDFIMD